MFAAKPNGKQMHDAVILCGQPILYVLATIRTARGFSGFSYPLSVLGNAERRFTIGNDDVVL